MECRRRNVSDCGPQVMRRCFCDHCYANASLLQMHRVLQRRLLVVKIGFQN